MKIYTGYFAQVKNYRKAGLKTIAVCLNVPWYYKGDRLLSLAPMPYMMDKSMSDEVFNKEYSKKVLGVLKQAQVYADLEQISDGKDVVLLCYEKLQEECHRGNIAIWMNEAGFDVQEFIIEGQKKSVPAAT